MKIVNKRNLILEMIAGRQMRKARLKEKREMLQRKEQLLDPPLMFEVYAASRACSAQARRSLRQQQPLFRGRHYQID